MDCKPDGGSQTPQDFKDQWNTITTKGSTVLLEMGGKILRSAQSGWQLLKAGDPQYDQRYPDRRWNYIEAGTTIELGYKYATHYHVANYP